MTAAVGVRLRCSTTSATALMRSSRLRTPLIPVTNQVPTEPDEDGQIIMTCLPVSPGNAWDPQEGALEEWIGPDDIDDVWLANGEGGCTNAKGCPSNTSSRRIIPLALFDPAHYAASGATGSNGVVKVVNVLGFFIEGTCGGGTPIDSAAFTHEAYLDCIRQWPGKRSCRQAGHHSRRQRSGAQGLSARRRLPKSSGSSGRQPWSQSYRYSLFLCPFESVAG